MCLKACSLFLRANVLMPPPFRPPQTSFLCPLVLSAAVGEATDDGEREKEDHVFGHLPRHRHHLRGVVALRSHRQNSRWNQTRSAQTHAHTHTLTLSVLAVIHSSTICRRLQVIHVQYLMTDLHKCSVNSVVWVLSVKCSLRLEYTWA